MLTTYVNADAARKLRHGLPSVEREEIARLDGEARPGEPAEIRDEDGTLLGFADVDLEAKARAVRRIGLPEESPEGLIQRHLRRALERRGQLVDDPRHCRLVHDDGDGLPGLVIDRFDSHYAVQTSSRAMDARTDEISRSLVEVLGASSVILRNDSPRRRALGLPVQRSHVLIGTPPRWTRVLDLGGRFTIDLSLGRGTGFFYDQREVRRLVQRLAHGARVLDPFCFIGGLFVHAGLHGARQLLAFEREEDAAELARENAEANGLLGRALVQQVDGLEALEDQRGSSDLVLFDWSESGEGRPGQRRWGQALRLCIRAVRHGGRLLVTGYPPLTAAGLDEAIAEAAELEGRFAIRLARAGLPPDFPTPVGAPEHLSAVAVELS